MRISKATCAAVIGAALFGIAANCTQPGLSLSISGPKDAVKVGSDVVVELTLENTTDHVIELTNLGMYDDHRWAETSFRATVKDGKGNAVPYTKHGKEEWGVGKHRWDSSAGDGIWKMAPGERATRALILSRLYNLTKSGVYVIQVTRLNWEDMQYPDTESNTITVAVTD